MGKSLYQFLSSTLESLFGFESLELELSTGVLHTHDAFESDVHGSGSSYFNTVEITGFDFSPESSPGTLKKLCGLFLVYQDHARCFDSSHGNSLVLGCSSRSHCGTRLFE
jgi:hypothetical protein